ncbi:MAG: ABC transporter permease [Chitinophagaceae bacterium]
MNKILLIIKREYLTRVRKRTFIISTILFPVLYLGLIFGTGYIASKSGTNLKVAVIDSSGYFDKGSIERENMKDSSSILTLVNNVNPDSLAANFKSMGYDGYVIIPARLNWEASEASKLTLFTSRTIGGEGYRPVQSKLNNIWNRIKNEKLGIDDTKKTILERNTIGISATNVNDKTADSGVATGIGYISGFLIYFILLLYGSQVMMGVMEEKTNRIAEVIVSSVKPFQLMLGKIIGIGMVALTQFLIWIAFIFIIYNVTSASGSDTGMMGGMVGGIQKVFTSMNISLILFCFIFYLLGGFFFYSSLYAAIGSAVNEDMREAQSLSFPITMLVIISIAMMSAAMKDPSGPLAVWGSIIPFSSPIIMMARIPFGVPETVPVWQLIASMVSLIVGFIFTTWFAGKIYRTGILMYGKKPTWKEMLKWAFRKN